MQKIKIFHTLLFSILNLTAIHSQDFYINQKSEPVFIKKLISPKWTDLNLNESRDFLNNSGFVEIKTSLNDEKVIVTGMIPNKEFIFTRQLIFKKQIITEYSDKIMFMQPCFICLANDIKAKHESNPVVQEINKNNIQLALRDDNRIKDLFFKYHMQSLNDDGIKSQILGDITDFGFRFSNSIKTEFFKITRNSSLQLNADKIYNFFSERRVEINEQNYFIGDINLNDVNLYDLNLMIDIFFLDCKNNGILLKKGKVVSLFEPLDGEILGLSYGINNDLKIDLKIDPIKWEKSSSPKKWYLLYHELGHDVLNLNHGNGGKMMFNFADKGYSWNEFWEDRRYMFESYKKFK